MIVATLLFPLLIDFFLSFYSQQWNHKGENPITWIHWTEKGGEIANERGEARGKEEEGIWKEESSGRWQEEEEGLPRPQRDEERRSERGKRGRLCESERGKQRLCSLQVGDLF